MDASNRTLQSLHDGWKGSVLHIQNGDLHTLPCMKGLNSVEILIVEGTKLASVSSSMLNASLKELVLRRNYLCGSMGIQSEKDPLPLLTSLCLSDNLVDDFPLVVATQLAPTLRSLDLENNSLSDFTSICVLTELQVLKLSHNRLKVIPKDIARLSNLQSLYLQHNSLTEIPAALGSLVKLRNLYLNDNHVGVVPVELGSLSGLRNLSLQHNVIRELPDDLFVNMAALQMLALNDNVLFSVPSSLGCLTQLNRLFLHENCLFALPAKIGLCAELSTLRVEYNELRGLPDSLTSCRSLIVLIAHNNKMGRVPECCAQMPQLLKFSLEFNPLPRDQARLWTTRDKAQDELDFAEFKANEDFTRAFEHFVVSRDLSRVRALNFSQGPSQAKMLLMRQHRDAELRMFLDGRAENLPTNEAEALAAHLMDPNLLVSQLANDPSEGNLSRILAGLTEFQDSWFALFMEFGGFEELLRLLHRLFLERDCKPESVVLLNYALRAFQVIFDAVWKTVLATASSVTLLLLHLDSSSYDIVGHVLRTSLDIARIPEIGAHTLLKGLSQRKKVFLTPEPRLHPLYRCADETSISEHRCLVLRLVNTVLEGLPLAERSPVRNEFLALHPTSSSAFLEMLDMYAETDSELNAELDTFLAQLREDSDLLAMPAVSATPSAVVVVVGGGSGGGKKSAILDDVSNTSKLLQGRTTRSQWQATLREGRGAAVANVGDVKAVVQVTAGPLVEMTRKDRQIKVPVNVKAAVRLLVEDLVGAFGAAPNFDYGLYYLAAAGSEPQMTWIDEDNTLVGTPGIVTDQGRVSTPLYLSVKPVSMTVRLPSGETRAFPIALAATTLAVIQDLSKHIEIAVEELALAQTVAGNRLKPNASLASQGVEPYTVLLLLNVAEELGLTTTMRHGATMSRSKGNTAIAAALAAAAATARPVSAQSSSSATNAATAPAEDGCTAESDEPLGNIWDEPHSDRYLVIENGEVTSATLNKMVERMTSTETIDLQLTQTFMIAYKSFTTQEELWGKLQERYSVPSRVPEDDRQKVRVRVCMFVKKWLEGTRRVEFPPSVLASIKEWAETQLGPDGLAEMQAVILRVLGGEKQDIVIQFDRAKCPKVKHPKVKQLDRMSVLDIDVTELARQVTIRTWELFCKIQPHEFFEQAWMKKNCQELAPNLLEFISFFNHFSNGVALQIISEPRFRKRAQLYERFIDVGVEIRKLNNFHIVMALISTFAQASINRLKFTYEKVSDGHKAKLKELQDLMNPTKSFQAYRAAYKESVSGIPYMGASLTDLLFISEATLSKVGPRINVQKHTSVCGVLEKLQMLKRRLPLNLEPEESIQKWIANMREISEKELYALSLQVEPRGATVDTIK